MNTMLTLDLIW